MWAFGLTMDRARLALLVLVTFPLLVGLSHVSGFEETFGARDDVVDAFVAYAVGFGVGAGVLLVLGVVGVDMPPRMLIAEVALQAVPGSMGALLAQSQLGHGGDATRREGRRASYGEELLLMLCGALFLAFNVAPTEEMILLAYIMRAWHVLALVALSLVVMHGFVYALDFRGGHQITPGTSVWSVFLRYTVTGYALALLVSAYVLWTFGRLDETGIAERITTVVVLGFPAAVGAAAARLIL
jgi:putative integral membrane protein (TIGR02587 family)